MNRFLLLCHFVMTLISVQAQGVKKTQMTEKDGYQWIRIINGNYWGAESSSGHTIVPMDFGCVYYEDGYFFTSSHRADHGPTVTSVYTKEGRCIISASRNFFSVCYNKAGFFHCSQFEGYDAVLDINGNDIISPNRYHIIRYNDNGYFDVWFDGSLGICGCNGQELIKPDEYDTFLLYQNGAFHAKKDGKWVHIPVSLPQSND